MKKLRKIMKNERGQGMLEYVLLLAIIAGLVMAFKGKITTIFGGATDALQSKSNSVFQDGQ
jgi:Flp pilus assembly pilin Flp